MNKKIIYIIISAVVLLLLGAFGIGYKIHSDNIKIQNENTVNYMGQTFKLKFAAPLQTNDKKEIGFINEFTTNNEDVKSWTQLIGYYHFYNMNLNQYFEQLSKSTQFIINKLEAQNVKIISFLIVSPDKTFVEYNVFKFIAQNNDVYGTQYAKKYMIPQKDGKIQQEELKKIMNNIALSDIKNILEINKQEEPKIYTKKFGKN